MTSEMLALNDAELDAVGGGKTRNGNVCVQKLMEITTDAGTLTLGTTTCSGGGISVSVPYGSWSPA